MPVTVNGWRLFCHQLLLDQLDRLQMQMERAQRTDPLEWHRNANVKVLTALATLMMHRIPRDPCDPIYRQGNTLGPRNRAWFRAKFGGNRFRLFYRYDSQSRVIIFVWVNDSESLRKAGSRTDPYAIFSHMLETGDPPGSWEDLLASAQDIPNILSSLSLGDDKTE